MSESPRAARYTDEDASPPRRGRRGEWPVAATLLLLAAVVLTTTRAAHSQQSTLAAPAEVGEIAGRVLDVESGQPLEGAIVTLTRLRGDPDGPTSGRDGGSIESRLMVTGRDGSYRFQGLPEARFRIAVERIGYFGTSLEVDFAGSSETRLSVGLEIRPIELAPLAVTGGIPEPYARMHPPWAAEVGGRLLTDRLRQERYLVADARELTHAEVVEAVTLAETDLFRALHRVPGVSTRDDYTATMWTRGASWDQTRVYFDGLPLYNPTHAGWLFAAVNPDAIGAASFHPGYRPVQWGDGAAAVLDLRSRSGRSGRPLHGNAEISLASARLALDGELDDGRIHWMLAMRRSYVDVVSGLAKRVMGNDDLHVPYDFSDVVARLDGALGGGWRYEASGILESDDLRGDIPGLLRGNWGRWGNRAGRVTLEGPVGPLHARVSSGGTDFSTLIFEGLPGQAGERATLPELENRIAHRTMSVELRPGRSSGAGGWSVGFGAMRDSVTYQGPFVLLGDLIPRGAHDELGQSPWTYGTSLAHVAFWGERRWALGERVHGIAGLRLEMGDSVHNGGTRRLAPRTALRFGPFGQTSLTAGYARSFQYTQDVAPAAGPVGPQLHLSAIWVLASPAEVYPAVKTDLGTLGVEQMLAGNWLVIGNLYHRASTGVKIPNPRAGAIQPARDPDAEADNAAYGWELSARRLAGRWTGSFGYAYGVSRMTLAPRGLEPAPQPPEPLRFPASADVRHAFDATSLVRLNRSLRLGGAFTYGSGVPFTRLVLAEDLEAGDPPEFGEPNAERAPSYASLDLVVDYSTTLRSWSLSGYLQLRNVMNRNNAVTYSGSRDCGPARVTSAVSDEFCADAGGITDRFEAGLPRLPLLGVRVAF